MLKRLAFFAAVMLPFVFSPARSLAGQTAIPAILVNPKSYDGQHVSVSGKVQHFEQKSHNGNPIFTFGLCASACVNIYGAGSPSIRNGRTIMVHGTFAISKHFGGYLFQDGIEADPGSL